jgi:hypothetical protein
MTFYVNTGRADGVDTHQKIITEEPLFVHRHTWRNIEIAVTEHVYHIDSIYREDVYNKQLLVLSGVVEGTRNTDDLSQGNHVLTQFIAALAAHRCLTHSWRILSIGGTSAHLVNYKA